MREKIDNLNKKVYLSITKLTFPILIISVDKLKLLGNKKTSVKASIALTSFHVKLNNAFGNQ